MARPRKIVDVKELENLAMIGCTVEEIGGILGISHDTITRRYASVLEKGRMRRNKSLRGKQFELAMKGDRTMLIWLGKQVLGQSDKTHITAKTDRLDELLEAIHGED